MLAQRTFFLAPDHTETVPQVSGTLAVTRGLESKDEGRHRSENLRASPGARRISHLGLVS